MGKNFLAKLLFIPWFCVIGSPLCLVTWLLKEKQISSLLVCVIGFWAMACFVGSWWLSSTTARYIIEGNQSFLHAVRLTLRDARIGLACVPGIGCWFTRDENMMDRKDDDD